MTEQEKHDMVGTTINCPEEVCDSGKLHIWAYHPKGNPFNYTESRERFETYDPENKSDRITVTLKEYESWQV